MYTLISDAADVFQRGRKLVGENVLDCTEVIADGSHWNESLISILNLNQGRSCHCVGSTNAEAFICWAGFYNTQITQDNSDKFYDDVFSVWQFFCPFIVVDLDNFTKQSIN